jgi:hypothetical protein
VSVVVSVHQPNFMPWLKLLDKILASDVYVAYDTVQYTKTEYHARQRIKAQHAAVWLTVPTLSVRGGTQVLQDVLIDDKQPFRGRQLALLRRSYGRADAFDEVYPLVEQVYRRGHQRLVDLNLDLIEAFCRYLGSTVQIVRASALPHDGDNTDRLVALVRAVGGDVHLTSTFGTERGYLDWERMTDAGITVRAQEFEHPVYPQQWGGFEAHLAAIDMLFCCGRATAEILREARGAIDVRIPAGHGSPRQGP